MQTSAKRWAAIALVFTLSLAFAGHVLAGSIDVNVIATVAGQSNTKIGEITATMGGNGTEGSPFLQTGTFNFTGPWGQLDNCYDFRWFQIITDIPEDLLGIDEFKFQDTDGDYTVSPTLPFVDPPNGGYQYQEADGGADDDPFYENTGPGDYAFPNFSELHTEGVSSSTEDSPGPEDVYFETYLVAIGEGIEENTFCVLAGYSWNTTLEAGELLMPDPVEISPIAVAHLQTALDSSGFTDAYGNAWTVETGCDLNPCPEPATWLLLALGGVVALGVRRRRQLA
jgi:hypothetical protein